MSITSVFSQKNFSLNSNQINRSVDYLPIPFGEKALIRKLAGDLTQFKDGGRDLASIIDIANGSLAAAFSVTRETVGKLKEALHARGIIFVDGKDWQSYRYSDGSRFKAKWVQRVTFTPSFIKALVDAARNRTKIDWKFDYHPDYVAKMEAKRARNLISLIKHRTAQVVDKVLNSCESLSMKSICQNMPTLSISSTPNYKSEKELNTENKEVKTATVLSKVNQNLSNSVSIGRAEFKRWTESVKKICLTLIASGKTEHEVGMLMVKQAYCRNFEHFKTLMNDTPMLC